jgi:O-antigen/teichoic acid export membrane protein
MKITAHLGKISWSLADKGLYVIYGLVQLLQIKALPADVYGVFALLVALNTWIMIVSDGSALAGIIKFGTNVDERRRINTMALSIHVVIVGISALLVYLIRDPLSGVFHEERFVTVATMLPLYCLLTLPRMFCLKVIYRDMRMRDLFIVDLVWFGVRTAMTYYALNTGSLKTLEDIIRIDFVGMGASSLAAIWFTRRDMTFGWKGSLSPMEYLRYGVPLALATALNSTPRQLDVLVIAAFFDVRVVGVYNPAKNLYRFFEQAFDAAVTLLYPAAVRMYAQQRMEDLQVLVTKVISATLIPTIVAVVVLELGGSNVITWLLGEQYAASVGHFNVLIIAALGMPFALMSSVIAAMGHSTTVVRYSAYSVVVGMAALYAVCFAGWSWAVGLGLVVNTIVVGLLCTANVRRAVHFPLRAMLRVIADARNAIPGFRGKA